MLRKLFVLMGPLAVAAIAACGGQVVFVEDGGEGGQGGSGTTGTTTKGTTKATTSATNAVSTKAVATTGSSVVVGTTSSGLVCDSGRIGGLETDLCSICQQCVFEDLCAGVAEQCGSIPECFEFGDCWNACGFDEPGCFQMCANQIPDGVGPFMALYDCVLCQECPFNCSGANFCGEG